MLTISINPIAFTIGSLEVRWYGIMIAIAVAVLIIWMIRHLHKAKAKLPAQPDIVIAPVAIIGGVIGAKLVHVLDMWGYYLQHPLEVFSGGGFAIFGGVLGAVLAIWIYLRIVRKEKGSTFGFFADIAAPAVLLAQAIGRVGCLINGCSYGKEAPGWLPWSVVYTNPNSFAPLNVPLHPVQVYEIIFCLVSFGILLRLRERFKAIQGALFLVYLGLYSAWRFGIGFLRSDVLHSGLNQAQIISLVLIMASIILVVHLQRRHRLAIEAA